ncbi:MAG TPA: hypothetical protein VMZ51_05625 [Acidimicrobiales bacterium]|nr:hypothetical protein [Acidimicrobiales bacterium]
MKVLPVLMTGAVLGAGVFGLAEATQNRPDPGYPGQVSELTLMVRTKDGYAHELAAEGLWGQCHNTVRSRRLVGPMVPVGAGRFKLVVSPALGAHAARRLIGCLEDATTSGVSGDVVEGPRRRPA